MANGIQLTKEGYEKLKKELDELQGPVRMAVAEAIREAKSHGDLRENAAYHEAKLNQTRLEHRISELEKALRSARIVERPEEQGDVAHLGSKVVLYDEEFDEDMDVILVGAFEADPANGMVSISSPMGESIVGRAIGDSIEVTTPGGVARYQIKSIEAS
ncbi:MAG: transcription elongation factor GreA [Armatimonadetes bacterium]|nr:transcription elongation factor GreA [Armatimonadota bacterium]MBS1702436.1 transcription elongation factor GreA [Armatimonadota bacterium]MBS1725864.1 transcription elongation factor GreA [Armatimonadota bacterium]